MKQKIYMNYRFTCLTRYMCYLMAIIAISLSTVSCSDDDNDLPYIPAAGLSDVYLAGSNAIIGRAPIEVRGHGFLDTDVVTFTAEDGTEFIATTAGVTDNGILLALPVEITNGTYLGRLERADGSSMLLGHTRLYWVLDTDVADVAGMTVKGTVSCDGKGLAGVMVSDGVEVTTTDDYGCYWLPSEKRNGYVFISMPSGYFTDNKSGIPEFFQHLTAPAGEIEQHDFALKSEPNDDYVLVVMADSHLANRGSSSNNDMAQFRDQFVYDVNKTIQEYKAEGRRVYGLTLGDLTWDSYWYDKNYDLDDAMKDFAKINVPIFHCIGNHDNDMSVVGDFETAGAWRRDVGPNNYSFNLGKVHYVVLDDINYHNTTLDRDQEAEIVPEAMNFLQKDLATIQDKSTPLVICMHIPLHGHPGRDEQGNLLAKYQLVNSYEFVDALAGFSKVRILSGHTHVNYNIPVNDNIIEHNIAGVCATWWWTGKYFQNHICRDGSVGGFGVFEWSGNDYKRYYKSMGYDRSYQFRTYDRNNIHITPEQYAPSQDPSDPTFIANFNYCAQDYAEARSNNEVMINVFSWEDSWKIEVTEDGKPLKTKITNWFDPLHIVSFDMFRVNKNNESLYGSPMKTTATTHLFRAYAQSATSTIEVKVTDCYGNVYTETMTRPKAFSYNMK